MKARVWLTATAICALLAASPSLAADLPVKARPIVAAGLDWSGVYVGVHAGYGGGMKDWGELWRGLHCAPVQAVVAKY